MLFTFFLKVFWHRDSIIFCNSPAVVLGESLATQTLPSHHALGRYRNIFLNIFCWLEILNYYPDGGNWNFHCSTAFLKATSQIFEAQLSFAAHQKSIFFFHCNGLLMEFGICFPSYFYFCKNRKAWLDNFMFIITLKCSNCEYEWEYTSEIFYSYEFQGVPIIVSKVYLRKNVYFIMILPPILHSYYPMNGSIFVNSLNKE